MKNKIKILNKLTVLGILLSLMSCDTEDFLDQSPKQELPASAVFSNYESIKTFSWQFYDVFPAYDQRGWNQYGANKVHGSVSTIMLRRGMNNLVAWSDFDSDLMDQGSDNGESDWIWNRVETPTSSYDYAAPYHNIRTVNIMLDGLESVTTLSEAEINHWKSVAYFFRAYNHASLINRYGDIVYVDKLLNDLSPELFGDRISRDVAAQKVLDELIWARDNIGDINDGANTINKDVINAFISRYGLMEGTWRKYHNLTNANVYLEASAEAAEELLPKYTLHPNYDEVFNSESLENVSGMILYKKYVESVFRHRTTQETRNDNAGEDITKKASDMYLFRDGQTIETSPLYEGQDGVMDFYAEHKNRDLRYFYTVTPSYRINRDGAGYTFTGNAEESQFFPIMESLSDELHKTLPSDQWTGKITVQQPNFYLNRVDNWNHSGTGYRMWKFYNRIVTGSNNVDINDGPIFRIGEVMLNYAEAKFELGEFDQAIADMTINKLRARGNVAPLTVGSEPTDSTRDADVDPTLWEIRRERAVELIGEGFRFDDIRRWKKGEYMDEQKLGRFIDKTVPSDFSFSNMPIQNGAQKGFIALDGVPPTWEDYYYLQPIPTDETVLNENLTPNPGWNQ